MTTFNRAIIPDAIRTNGATPNPWWSNAVVYHDYRTALSKTRTAMDSAILRASRRVLIT